MRYLGLSTLVIAALLANGCGKTESGDDGPGRPNSGPSGQMTKGSGGSGFAPGGGLFGNPSGAPTGAGGSHVANPDDVTCAKSHITATRIVPTVLLLLDGSSSMLTCYGPDNSSAAVDGGTQVTCPPDETGGIAPPPPPAGAIDRWTAVRRAVTDPNIGVVARLQDRVMFGVAVFGTMPSCPLPLNVVAPALNNFDMISGYVPMQPPGLFTPTGVALDMIVDMLPDPVNGALDMTIGPQIIVLATDGDPNTCGDTGLPVTDYGPSIAAAMKLTAKNQRMYVISVGSDAGKAHLQEMANIGAGMPQQASPGAEVYYPEDPAALADTLAVLIGAELSCDLALEGKGVVESMACLGEVMLNGQKLECDGADGWELKDKTHITLKGKACETFKMGADALLDAEFPCEALIVD